MNHSSHAVFFLLVSSLLASASLTLSACASDGTSPAIEDTTDGTVKPDASNPSSTTDAGVDAEPPPPPCDDAQTAAIKASFEDETIPADVGAVAMVKDPSCGVRYFTRGASKDVPEDALHLIGSNSKTYIASLTLLLVEEGKLSLSDSVSKWVPNVPGGAAVKVEHLLHHTSGIYNYTSDIVYLFGSVLGSKYKPSDLLGIAIAKAPSFAPGEPGKWEYSNTNYVILGLIIEAVTGRPVAEVLRERVLGPIGAKATFFRGGEPLVGTLAFGKSFLGSNGANVMDPSASWCAGNLAATMGDLTNWAEMRGNGTFHSPAMQAELTKGVPTGAPFNYGAALVMADETMLNGNGPAIGHGGDIVGFHNSAYYFPKKKATIVVMVDSDKGPSGGFPFGATYLEEMLMTVVNPYFGTKPQAKSP